MNLREIQASWNALVPVATARGIAVSTWAVPPQTRDRGMRRLNWLRAELGIPVVNAAPDSNIEHAPGASLPPIREIVSQYNALIPEAQRRGLNVRLWTGIPSTTLRGYQRLQKLRRQLGQTVSVAAITTVVEGVAVFNPLTFGVELEVFMPRGMSQSDLAYHLTQAGIPTQVEHYNHIVRKDHWKIVTDGSLGNYSRGIELVSPPLNGEAGFELLRKACKLLVQRKVKPTSRCGFHVHVGWREGIAKWSANTLRNVVKTYRHFESGIDSVLTPSRRGAFAANGFANAVVYGPGIDTAMTLDDIANAMNQETYSAVRANPRMARSGRRYRKLNIQCLGVYETIEFRHHHGTVDADAVENWLRFVLRLVLAASNNATIAVPVERRDFATLADTIGMDAKEKQHFARRIATMARVEERARQRANRVAA